MISQLEGVKRLAVFVTVLAMCPLSLSRCHAQTSAKEKETHISLEKKNGTIVVMAGDELFTRYDFSSHEKPVLHPVFGPQQIRMTRDWPMKVTDGEANDHPHHKSMWLGHEINGIDFWSEKTGTVKHDSVVKLDTDRNCFAVKNNWISKKDGSIVCTEDSTFGFGGSKNKRWIDATHTFNASHGDVHFEDTKEGMFALRTHPDLRLNPDKKRGVEQVFGNAINSQGTTGKAIWGQSAKWVYYWGTIDEKVVGIAIFDHPTNFRHPTTWHAREYGLVAANPFGLHHFKKVKKGDGAHTVKKGGQITFRYRVVFQLGKQSPDELNRQFDEWVAK